MKKRTIYLEPISNKFVKFGKEKIEVKPYLSTEDIASMVLLCNRQYEFDNDNFAMVRLIFDVLVIDKCTDVEIEGVESKKEDGKTNTSVNVDKNIIERFDNSRLIDAIKPLVVNYQDAWEQVVKSIELKNTYNVLSSITSNLPSMDDMGKALETSLKSLADYGQKDPEGFKQIIKETVTKDVRENARKEVIEAKKKNKK